jgi:hypothetical protein
LDIQNDLPAEEGFIDKDTGRQNLDLFHGIVAIYRNQEKLNKKIEGNGVEGICDALKRHEVILNGSYDAMGNKATEGLTDHFKKIEKYLKDVRTQILVGIVSFILIEIVLRGVFHI